MKNERFLEIVNELWGIIQQTIEEKGKEYMSEGEEEDRLEIFKMAGAKRHETPEEALMGIEVKHDCSLDIMIKNLKRKGILPAKEKLFEKIKDRIIYSFLLAALFIEIMDEKEELNKDNINDSNEAEIKIFKDINTLQEVSEKDLKCKNCQNYGNYIFCHAKCTIQDCIILDCNVYVKIPDKKHYIKFNDIVELTLCNRCEKYLKSRCGCNVTVRKGIIEECSLFEKIKIMEKKDEKIQGEGKI